MLRDLFLELFIRNLFFLRRKSMPYNELLRFAPYLVRPFEFAPTLCRVRPHTFRVRPHQVEFAP